MAERGVAFALVSMVIRFQYLSVIFLFYFLIENNSLIVSDFDVDIIYFLYI